jgi:hypothetical protein
VNSTPWYFAGCVSHLLGEHDLGGTQEGHAMRGEEVDTPAERCKDDVADGTRKETCSASAGLKVKVRWAPRGNEL